MGWEKRKFSMSATSRGEGRDGGKEMGEGVKGVSDWAK